MTLAVWIHAQSEYMAYYGWIMVPWIKMQSLLFLLPCPVLGITGYFKAGYGHKKNLNGIRIELQLFGLNTTLTQPDADQMK